MPTSPSLPGRGEREGSLLFHYARGERGKKSLLFLERRRGGRIFLSARFREKGGGEGGKGECPREFEIDGKKGKGKRSKG